MMGPPPATNEPASSDEQQQLPRRLLVPPAPLFVLTSIPLLWRAHVHYHRPLDPMIQDLLRHRNLPGAITKTSDDGLKRVVASAVATRALRVATLGTLGAFGLVSGAVLAWCGQDTIHDNLQVLQDVAQRQRQALDRWLGMTNGDRIDRSHPEYQRVANMTENEELDYLARTYLPQDEVWDQEVETGSKTRERR